MQPRATDDPAVAAAFLNRYLEDAEARAIQDLAAYQALFPGHEALVERELAALVAPAGAPGPDGDDAELSFGPYRILSELGRGGQGIVHLALDTRLSRRVALKILSRPAPGADGMLLRFRREAEVASRLDHPGICAVYESGVHDGRAFIAMRYVEGETLAARIAKAARTPHPSGRPDSGGRSGTKVRDEIAALVTLFEKAALALDAAHEAGIVHRDVKPGNVMVTPGGEPVLLDFGLARDEESDSGLTRTGDVFGTPAYMSPEQISGGAIDRRTDVYSLGATMYECLTLERPFQAPTREALYQAILTADLEDPGRRVPELSRDLTVVLRTALERDRDRRYQSARDLAAELGRVRAHEPIQARPAGRLLRAWRFCQRNPALATTTAFAFALLLTALVVTILLLEASEENHANVVAIARQEQAYAREIGEKSRALERANVELAASLEDARAGRLSKQEEHVQGLIGEGYRTFFGGQWKPARQFFVDALEADPGNTSALTGLFWYELYSGGDPFGVLDEHGTRDSNLVLWLRGFAYERRGDRENAERCFALSARSDEDDDVRAYVRALSAVDTFDPSAGPDKARASLPDFRRAIDLAQRPVFHYWHGLMMAADRAGERATVDVAAEALTNHWPDDASTWDAIAQFYYRTDPERALDALHRILAIGDSGMARIGLSQHALGRGDVVTARAELDRALAAEPELVPAWFMLGSFLIGQGQPAEAVEPLFEAIRLEPTNSYPYTLLRTAFDALGDERAALTDEELAQLAALRD